MKKIYLSTLIFILSACASLTKVSKKNDELVKIKKVAVVGFSLVSEEPETVYHRLLRKAHLSFGNQGNINGGVHPEVTLLYNEFIDKLKEENNWQVLSAGDLDKNFEYKKFVTDGTSGNMLRPIVPDLFTVYRPNNIIDAEAFSFMKQEEKVRLVNALGVDAIIIVKVISSLEEEGGFKKYIGQSEFRPNNQVSLEMIDSKNEKSIWSDSWAWGAGDKAIPSMLRAVDSGELMEQVKVATRHAYNELFNRYKAE